MENENSYDKIKIIFINIFAILFKATSLNIYRLQTDMRDVKMVVGITKQEVWIRELFTFLISGLILLRFLMCFAGLASNIIAIFPLLTNTQGELLLPTIVVQSIDNVVLNIYEMLLGYCSMRFLHPDSVAVFVVFFFKMLVKTTCSISTINAYSDLHQYLMAYNEDEMVQFGPYLSSDSSEEFEIAHQNLR